jgi:hypothetical protein
MNLLGRHLRVLQLVLALTIVVSACQCQNPKAIRSSLPTATPTTPAPATPIDAKKAELGGKTWDPDWDMSETDKREFWAYFFQALAGAEAGLDPKTRVHHTEPEVSVRDEVSGMSGRTEGLLQLTYADQKRYGCDFDWQADRKLPAKDPSRTILQPQNNLECGVKILANQIIVSTDLCFTVRATGQRCNLGGQAIVCSRRK